MSAAPAALLAGQAREAVSGRAADPGDSVWDQPPMFTTWTWDGTSLSPRAPAVLDSSVHPDLLPELITSLAARDYAEHEGPPYAYAYQLTFEGFAVAGPAADASLGMKLLHEIDRAARAYHKRIDSIELVSALVADVHGRLFTATAYRSERGHVEERRYPPGRHPGGKVSTALIAAATATGHLAYGYPAAPAPRLEAPRG